MARTSYNIDTMANKPLSKKELIERLKAIAADDSPREDEVMSAMCYCPAVPPMQKTKCDICGSEICYMGWGDDKISDYVKGIASLGYDVKVETVCESCAKKLKEEIYPNMKPDDEDDIWITEINHLFFFRTSANEEYHRAIANDESQYRTLLAFLQNEKKYLGGFDTYIYLADEIDTIEFMTGIKIDA